MKTKWTKEAIIKYIEEQDYIFINFIKFDKLNSKILIRCNNKKHELYEVTFANFKSGRRCPKCSEIKRRKKMLFSTLPLNFLRRRDLPKLQFQILQIRPGLPRGLFTSILRTNMISGINWFPTRPENCFSGPMRLYRMHISANLTGRYILLQITFLLS